MNVSSHWEYVAVMNALQMGYFNVSMDDIDFKRPKLQSVLKKKRMVIQFDPECATTTPVVFMDQSQAGMRAAADPYASSPAAELTADVPQHIIEPLVGDTMLMPTTAAVPVPGHAAPPSASPLAAGAAMHSAPVTSPRGSIAIQPIVSGLLSEALRGAATVDSDAEVNSGRFRGRQKSETATGLRFTRDSASHITGGRTSELGSGAGDIIKVIVYLPSKMPLKLRIPDSATAADTIAEVLRQAKTNGITLPGDSRCYELRLHDEDGEPDDDFPALDRTRAIRNFGQGGLHEYCLRAIPSALAALETTTSKLSTPVKPAPDARVMSESPSQSLTGSSHGLFAESSSPSLTLRVVIPGHPTPTVCMVPVTDNARIQDVIDYVAKRQRLPVYHEKYVVKVSPVDQLRLSLPTRELPPYLLVQSLSVDSVELSKKTYADSPAEKPAVSPAFMGRRLASRETDPTNRHSRAYDLTGRDGDSVAAAFSATTGGMLAGEGAYGAGVSASLSAATHPTSNSLARPTTTPTVGPGGLMHNAITAAQFQEWHVIKINKRGRRQERLMGMDLTRITNRKVEKKRFISDKTMNAERLISDIKRVEIPDNDPIAFNITFKESGEDVTLCYETQIPREREEIVSKLSYILKMNGDQRKIVRTA